MSFDARPDLHATTPAAVVDPDWIGTILAAACLVHCVALPLLVGFAPIVSRLIVGEWLSRALLVGSGLTLAWALPRGFRRHRRLWPAAAAVAGFAGLVVAETVLSAGTTTLIWSIAGGAAIVVGHQANARLASGS